MPQSKNPKRTKNPDVGKQPKQSLTPHTDKNPKTQADGISYESENVQWSFGIMDSDGPFGWKRCTLEQVLDAFKFLANIETMRWSELKGKNHHSIHVSSLSEKARKRLEQIEQETDDVFSLRKTAKIRIFGIRDRAIFRILWLDLDHEVCPIKNR